MASSSLFLSSMTSDELLREELDSDSGKFFFFISLLAFKNSLTYAALALVYASTKGTAAELLLRIGIMMASPALRF